MSLTATITNLATQGPSGPINDITYDFGDGSGIVHDTSQTVTHTYAAGGAYAITQTVTGSGSDGTVTITHLVTVAASTGGGGGGGFATQADMLADFVSFTTWSRPSFTPVRTRHFSDIATLKSYAASAQPGDLIQIAPGAGALLGSASSGPPPLQLHGINPSGPVVIDLGTHQSVWGSPTSADYVKFLYSGSDNQSCVSIDACSNLHIYGGVISIPLGNNGVLVEAASHHISWYDGYVDHAGGCGNAVRGNTGAGAASDCHNLDFQFEINRPGMNPTHDPHPDKGTGIHGCILHGNSGAIHDSRFVYYVHDPLQPGESSAGKVWPGGSLGSVVEQGNDALANYDNVLIYAFGANMKMIPLGLNPPGSTIHQTAGNILNNWGNNKLNGGKAYLWGWNCTGAMLHSDTGGWHPGSPPFEVPYARAHNMNQSHAGGNISVPYPTSNPKGTPLGITYGDCQVV